jgi:DNA-directed RNA polymerase specialized sigma24 family protein
MGSKNFMYGQKIINLADFNRLILQHQEAAYTLAFYTLGDERQACETVHKAITDAFQRPAGENFKLRILQGVTNLCSQLPAHSIDLNVVPEIVQQLSSLSFQERLAVVLIDILGLNYAQAAQVCRQPKAQLSRLLAQARVHMLSLQPL